MARSDKKKKVLARSVGKMCHPWSTAIAGGLLLKVAEQLSFVFEQFYHHTFFTTDGKPVLSDTNGTDNGRTVRIGTRVDEPYCTTTSQHVFYTVYYVKCSIVKCHNV